MSVSTMVSTITVRRFEALDDYRSAEALQERIWGAGDLGRSSLVDMLTAQSSGGTVIGAFARDELVGFVFSILGMAPDGTLKQASILLGVHPEFRGLGLGRKLKEAQAAEALSNGISTITWTFDPLVVVNADLNVAQLGGTSREYLVNHYGHAAGLNAGLPTDRLVLEWNLDVPHTPAFDPASARPVCTVGTDPRTGHPVVLERLDHLKDLAVFLPIPAAIDAMKVADLGLARDWRATTGALFRSYFRRGYVVVGFSRGAETTLPGYLLERRP